VQNSNVRNKPVDLRYLSDQDKSDYKQSGAMARRIGAVKRAKAYRGQLAWDNKRDVFRTELKPGTGGFTVGLGAQQQRLREEGQKVAQAKALRPAMKDITSKLYQ